jgi:hypothetical protein
MGSKRKRCMDDSPLSVSSYTWSTPETQSPIPFPHDAMQMDVDACSRNNGWDFANASRVKSSDWGNRTRKRFRDNRPDERSIHGMSCDASDIGKGILIPRRNYPSETLLRTTQPPRRLSRSVRTPADPTTNTSTLEASTEVDTTFVLETASCAPRPAHLLATPPSRASIAVLRRLRLAASERRWQHERRHGYRPGWPCGEQSFRM